MRQLKKDNKANNEAYLCWQERMLQEKGPATSAVARDARHRQWLDHVWESDLPGGRKHLDKLTSEYEGSAPRKLDDLAEVLTQVQDRMQELAADSDEGDVSAVEAIFVDDDSGEDGTGGRSAEDNEDGGGVNSAVCEGMVEDPAQDSSVDAGWGGDDKCGSGGEDSESEHGEQSGDDDAGDEARADSDSDSDDPELERQIEEFCANIITNM